MAYMKIALVLCITTALLATHVSATEELQLRGNESKLAEEAIDVLVGDEALKVDIERESPKGEEIETTLFSAQIGKLNTDIAHIKAKIDKTDWFTPLISFSGVVVGAWLGGYISLRLHKEQTNFEIRKSLIDWKIQQLAQLYGPLRAMLKQSNALYRQMNGILCECAPNRFRLRDEDENLDFDNKVFELVGDDNEWETFRTISHLDIVYDAQYGVREYFDEILIIGTKMADIIEKNAGYVRDDQNSLADVFGKYLAHHKVLQQVYNAKKSKSESHESAPRAEARYKMVADKSAAFPREIHQLVEKGFKSLNSEINSWGESC